MHDLKVINEEVNKCIDDAFDPFTGPQLAQVRSVARGSDFPPKTSLCTGSQGKQNILIQMWDERKYILMNVLTILYNN